VVFPGLWFASVVAVCDAYVWWGDLAVYACGTLTYAAAVLLWTDPTAQTARRVVAHVFAVIAVLYGSGFLTQAYAAYTRDPIGESYERSDDAFLACREIPVPLVSNGRGEVAQVRRLWCTFGPIGNKDLYFVFVHGYGDRNARQNLVFRYEVVDGNGVGPVVGWASDSSLLIAIPTQFRQVTAQRTSIDGIRIAYDIGGSRCDSAITPQQRLLHVVESWLGEDC
jgi:hypothetical protein